MLFYFGEANPETILAVRHVLPPQCFLFWACPPGSSSQLATQMTRIKDFPGPTHVCAADPEAPVEEMIASAIMAGDRSSVRFIVQQGFAAKYPGECRRIQAAIKMGMDNASMEQGRGLIFLRASLLNLGFMATRWTSLPRVAPETPALVCAAGPSLREQLEEIRALAPRVLLIAVGHALPTLLRAGIRPHVVVEDDAVAGQNWPDDLDVHGILLVAACTVDARVSKRFERIVWCEGSSPYFNRFMAKSGWPMERMTLLKTVSTHALDAAFRMGCRRIGMVGQDFSLGPSGMLHADGRRKVGATERLVETPANEGGTVTATKDLIVLRESVETYINLLDKALAHSPDKPRIINCTRHGALIKGTQRASLSEFAQELSPAPFSMPPLMARTTNRLSEIICLPDTVKEMAGHIKTLAAGLPVSVHQDLMETIREDLHSAHKQMESRSDAHEIDRRPEEFCAFQRFAVEYIRASNPALTNWLNENHHIKCPERFRFRWKNQTIPVMEVQPLEGGDYTLIAGEWSMLEQAREEINAFTREILRVGMQQKVGLVALGPCNWIYILEAMRAMPNLTNLIVVEPWIESLAAQILHGCFIHKLPVDTLIIGADNRIHAWRELYQQRISLWEKNAIKPVIFIPRCIAEWKEFRDLRMSLFK